MMNSPSIVQIERLRNREYNAEITSIKVCHDDLIRILVRPDRGIPRFLAGQYTVLGLGNWEPRVPGVQREAELAGDSEKLIKRAYSISCPMLDDNQRIVRASTAEAFEFYITLVRNTSVGPAPALTPRLFALKRGDRLFCGPHIHGNYTLRRVRCDDNIVFASTGTGEAPHNAMLAELLATGHRGQIAMVSCVRLKQDLGYLETHQQLAKRFANYTFVPLTTREPENLDASLPGFLGKRYLQDYFASGALEQDTSLVLSPDTTQVFLCGGPEMIGVPHHTHAPERRYPEPVGMIEVLERRGFRVDRPHEPGNVHFEKYW